MSKTPKQPRGSGSAREEVDPRQIAELALGRILRLGSRPSQPGDAAEYARCRALILDAIDPAGTVFEREDPRPNWPRDRFKGAQGD